KQTFINPGGARDEQGVAQQRSQLCPGRNEVGAVAIAVSGLGDDCRGAVWAPGQPRPVAAAVHPVLDVPGLQVDLGQHPVVLPTRVVRDARLSAVGGEPDVAMNGLAVPGDLPEDAVGTNQRKLPGLVAALVLTDE